MLINILIIILIGLIAPTEEIVDMPHPCSDQILIEARVISPNCSGKDGQIIFTNPSIATGASFAWSHDSGETGDNVDNLDSGKYTITVTQGVHVRVTKIILE